MVPQGRNQNLFLGGAKGALWLMGANVNIQQMFDPDQKRQIKSLDLTYIHIPCKS